MAGTVIEQILECLTDKQNILLSGGAGSGKTHTLIQTLNSVFKYSPTASVACITYTNVAANEIKERSPYSKLHVSTIHDFLWDIIKGYQKNIKQTVLALLEAEKLSRGTGIPYSGEDDITGDSFAIVEYRSYRKIEKGIVSHDDVLKIANYMFEKYPLLSKILCDKYDYIFIDEYQDTQKLVVEIFLKHIKPKAKGVLCIGFFGDKMQSIYDTGVQDIQAFVDSGDVKEIIKSDNYRCSIAVINLLNNIRSDIKQSPAKKLDDGSVGNKIGSAVFIHSREEFDLEMFKHSKFVSGWDFDNPVQTKVLFLTHRLIARRMGFEELLGSYGYTDNLIGNEPDRLASHLLKITGILHYYEEKSYRNVIEDLQYRVKSISDKGRISKLLNELLNNQDINIKTMIERFDREKLIRIDDRLGEYATNNKETYDKVMALPFTQAMAYFNYYNNFSPYSTQHGIKGAEFDNVLVVLDNGNWNNYNFKYYFEKTSEKERIISRTERIYYVCCSRTKDNFVVFYPSPTPQIITQAEKLFGRENVYSM